MASDSDHGSTFNPRRKLCPDGSCVGIIGDDGRCTVCGTGDAGLAGPPETAPTNDDAPDDTADDTDMAPGEAVSEEPPSGFDPHRRLCSDDDCIGVIDGDNRCGLCGRPAAS
jgi:hypothetical protein